MKTLLRIIVGLVLLVVLIGLVAYVDGRSLPVDHTTSVAGIVSAPPARVLALITDVAAAPSWRHSLRWVKVLPPEDGHTHWVEDLGHGTTMDFVALRSDTLAAAPASQGTVLARRDVLLNDPGAQYGGTWIYELSPGPTPDQTSLKITEIGFIKPPIYRFMMRHIMGMSRNLDQYLSDIQAAART